MQMLTRASLIALAGGLLPAAALAQSCNTADRSVLLILDASGSMNAKLPNGETRIAVAQRAIKGVAGFVPAQAQLSLRMYGAQSPASQKNCQDTNLAVPFGPASASGGAITASVDGAKAQGYTPIAYSLGQAANDFPADAKERVIVLVSDGKETCQGDPVVAAKALAAKGITVHTVGFIVDTAARGQLQAIAQATGGTYFDAPVGPELPDTLKQALNACKKRVVTLPPKPQPGKLRTTSRLAYSHDIVNAETGQKVATFDRCAPAGRLCRRASTRSNSDREAGRASRCARARPPRSTPGELRVQSAAASVLVHATVVDSETGEKHGSFDPMASKVTLMPGVYDLQFAQGGVALRQGRRRQDHHAAAGRGHPRGRPEVEGARITTQDGTEVFRFNAVTIAGGAAAGRLHRRGRRQQVPVPRDRRRGVRGEAAVKD